MHAFISFFFGLQPWCGHLAAMVDCALSCELKWPFSPWAAFISMFDTCDMNQELWLFLTRFIICWTGTKRKYFYLSPLLSLSLPLSLLLHLPPLHLVEGVECMLCMHICMQIYIYIHIHMETRGYHQISFPQGSHRAIYWLAGQSAHSQDSPDFAS